MDKRAALYQQFDPARPLEADEEDLYVDWLRALGADDVKQRLANSIALSGPVPVCRLFTGHRGVGKTTELKRVARILSEGGAGRKLFVSFLQAERWMDLEDVRPPDIVFHIVRQLVDDLAGAGFGLATTKLGEFFGEIRELLNSEVELKDVKIPAGIAEFGLALKQVPRARGTLRRLLEGHLPSIYDLINEKILRPAKEWLRANLGCEDVLVVVDEVNRIPQKAINERGLTNLESIFLDNANVLRILACDVLYTIPIELTDSPFRQRLKLAYGTEVLTLPGIPVAGRDDTPCEEGLGQLRRILDERVRKAGATRDELFECDAVLDRLCRVSGGHVRSLLILLRSALERCDRLPITREVAERTIRRAAIDVSLPLLSKEWRALREVHRSKRPAEEDPGLWSCLVGNLYVLAYEDEQGPWYDWNPLLGELPEATA